VFVTQNGDKNSLENDWQSNEFVWKLSEKREENPETLMRIRNTGFRRK
jgi:hypothetical protein